MYSNYLADVKESAFKGVFTLFKKSVKYHALVYLALFILTIIATLITVGSMFMQIQNPTALSQEYQSFFTDYVGLFFLLIPIAMLVGAWFYTLGLSINDNIVKTERGDIGQALKNSFSRVTFQMFLYFLLLIGIYLVSAIVIALVIALFTALSKVFGIILAVIIVLGFLVFYMRFLAGPSYIVHGKMGAVEALKASFQSITWIRAIIICVIGIGLTFAFYFLVFGLLLMMGLNIFDPNSSAQMMNQESMSGLGTKMILYQIFNFIIAVVVYSFGYAAISSFYFRYNQSDAETEEEQLGEHLISE